MTLDAEDLPRVVREQRHNYENLLDQNTQDKLISILGQAGRLPRGVYDQVHTATGIPLPNLKRWRRQILDGVNPFDHNWRHRPRLLPKELEDQIFATLMERISQGIHCPRPYLRRVALEIGRTHDEGFQAGRSWMKCFLKRYNLSFRKPHIRRRTKPNDPIVAEFLQMLEVARLEIPDSRICNMDETAWRLTNRRLETLAKRGSDEVVSSSLIDERTCVTVICTVTATGKKLPPWVILKGKTEKTMARYAADPRLRRYIDNKRLYLTYSPKGWSTTDVMKEYLSWFSEQMDEEWSVLIGDLYSVHRSAEIKEWAYQHHINLVFIPAGQTSVWQPLDRRIFGALMSKAQKKLNTLCALKQLDTLNMTDAVWILLQSWTEVSKTLVKKSWQMIMPQIHMPEREEEDTDVTEQGTEDEAYTCDERILEDGHIRSREEDESDTFTEEEEEEDFLEFIDNW